MDQNSRLSTLRQLGSRLRHAAASRSALPFALGLALGLFAAWFIWPVSWYDTDPSDLRARHKAVYILGVADSLAITGDTVAANERILELSDAEIDVQQVADLVESVALDQEDKGNRAAALRIRRMMAVTKLPAPGAAPAPLPEPEEPAKAKVPLWLLLVLGLSLIGAAGAIWGVMYYLNRRAQGGVAPDQGQSVELPRHHQLSDLDAQGMDADTREPVAQAARSTLGGPSIQRESPAQTAPARYRAPQTEGQREAQPGPPREAPSRPRTLTSADREGDDDDLLEETVVELTRPRRGLQEPADEPAQRTRRMPDRDLPRGTLRAFEAEYIYGYDDYDKSESIEAQNGEFLGECGLNISSILEANGAQKVNALAAWLFDKSDRRTVTYILATPRAYENEALNTQLSAKGEVIPAVIGQTFVIETLYLQATAIIQDVSYLPDTSAPEAAFERVRIEFVVEKANGLG